jgi:hypothetical protein
VKETERNMQEKRDRRRRGEGGDEEWEGERET